MRVIITVVFLCLGLWAQPSVTTFTVDCGGGASRSCTTTSGSNVTLAWSTSGAGTRIVIAPGIGSVAASGSQTVNPTTTTAYSIQAVDTTSSDEAVQYALVAVGAGTLSVSKTTDCSGTIVQDAVCSITLTNGGTYSNQQENVFIWATFTGPANSCYLAGVLGTTCLVRGYADTAGQWKVNFRPLVSGSYTYALTMGANPSSGSPDYYITTGSFTVSSSSNPGILRINPSNAYGIIQDNGAKPVLLMGLNHNPQGSSTLVSGSISTASIPATDGDFIGRGGTSGNLDTFNSMFSNAGFNLDRVNGLAVCSKSTCFNQTGNLNVYDLSQAALADQWITSDFTHNIWTQLIMPQLSQSSSYIGSNNDPFSNDTSTRKFLDMLHYAIDRYGYAVGIWELENESNSPPLQVLQVYARYYHEQSPYRQLVTTSWQGGVGSNGSYMDVTSVHTYETVIGGTLPDPQATTTDATYTTANAAALANNTGKPIQFGEAGPGCAALNSGMNAIDLHERAWWRIAAWSEALTRWSVMAPFLGIGLADQYCTQSSSGSTLHMEGFIRSQGLVLQRVFALLDGTEAVITPSFTQPGGQTVRRYAMAGSTNVIAYLHHANTHSSVVTGETLTITVPSSGMTGQWIDPATGLVLSTITPSSGSHALSVPNYQVDIALILVPTANLPTLTISPQSLQTTVGNVTVWGMQAGVSFSQTFTATGGTGPYTWSITAGSLPSGMSLSSGGLLSGVPSTAIVFSTEYPFTVTVSDSASHTVSLAYWGVVGFWQPYNPNYVTVSNATGSPVTTTSLEFDCTFLQGTIPHYPGIRTIPTIPNSGNANSFWSSTVNSTWGDGSANSATILVGSATTGLRVNANSSVVLGFHDDTSSIGNNAYAGSVPAGTFYSCVEGSHTPIGTSGIYICTNCILK